MNRAIVKILSQSQKFISRKPLEFDIIIPGTLYRVNFKKCCIFRSVRHEVTIVDSQRKKERSFWSNERQNIYSYWGKQKIY